MRSILTRRVYRDLKKHLFRYLALFFLIVLGMYLVISMAGGADMVERTVYDSADKNKVEDGEFSLFVPLSDKSVKELEKKGVTLEEQFYMDCTLSDSSVLRLFVNREKINRIELEEGRQAEADKEIVLEKKYAQDHKIGVGDFVVIGTYTFEVVGIGSTPDYDCVLKSLADATAQSEIFGTAFVTKDQYKKMLEQGNVAESEAYVYSYLESSRYKSADIKKYLKDLKVESSEIDNEFFQDAYENKMGNLESGLSELKDGSQSLAEGLEALTENNSALQNGTQESLDNVLERLEVLLQQNGVQQKVTEENYKEIIEQTLTNGVGYEQKRMLREYETQITKLQKYRDAIVEYTDGTEDAAEGAQELKRGIKKFTNELEEKLEEAGYGKISNLLMFVKKEDNARIYASVNDILIMKYAGLAAGILILMLFTYIISVFVIHNIEAESSIIGTLYAMGMRKNEIVVHYLILPTVISFIAGLIGTALGFSPIGAGAMGAENSAYYSIPELKMYYSIYLLLYGVVLPPVVALVVNFFAINKKLSATALSMMRKEKKENKAGNIPIKSKDFIKRFQIRLFFRELRAGITLILGMFMAILILTLGVDCYTCCSNMRIDNENDVKFEYMYTYKYPTQEAPDDGEACYAETLKREIYGYDFDVIVLGIDEDNPYFAYDLPKEKNSIAVSNSTAAKYNLKMNDEFVLRDENGEKKYVFTVDQIVDYSVGLYVFMDIDNMRELFGQDENYYNVVLSEKELDIETGRLYTTLKKGDILKSADVFITIMQDTIYIMIGVAIIIFIIVMYLMLNVIIEKSTQSIAMFKILGYRDNEVKKLYLNGNFLIVAVGAVVCIALCKVIVDAIYPVCFVTNVACGMNYTYKWYIYILMYAGVILSYFLTNLFLVRKLKKISLNDILKNRE